MLRESVDVKCTAFKACGNSSTGSEPGALHHRQLVELQKDLKGSTESMLSSSQKPQKSAADGGETTAGSQRTRHMHSSDDSSPIAEAVKRSICAQYCSAGAKD